MRLKPWLRRLVRLVLWTVMAEIGWCGFGVSRGPVPEVRLLFVRFAITRGSVVERLRSMLATLSDAAIALRQIQRPRIVPAPPPAAERTRADRVSADVG